MDIYKSNGELFTSLADGTTSTVNDAPVILAGRNFAGYGKMLNENQLRLAENFASDTPPPGSIVGQLWFNTQTNSLSVYRSDTVGYKDLSVQTITNQMPTQAEVGDLWFDTIADQLKVYASNTWKVVGPLYDKNLGQSGIVPAVVTDINAIDHVVSQVMRAGNIVAIISAAEFIPNNSIAGFDTIRVGINASSLLAGTGFMFHGKSADSLALGNTPANMFVRKDQDSVINADVHVNGKSTVKTYLTLDLQPTTNKAQLANTYDNADLELLVTTNGVTSPAITIEGATAEAQVANEPQTDRGISSKHYVDSAIQAIQAAVDQQVAGITGTLQRDVDSLTVRMLQAEVEVRTNVGRMDNFDTALLTKANIISPEFVGVPTAQTPGLASNDTSLATTEWVRSTNDTLREEIASTTTISIGALSAALTTEVAKKAPRNSPVLTGEPRSTNPDPVDSSTRIATTEFVKQTVKQSAKWQGSSRVISYDAPAPADGVDGDFWFVIGT
jgi:hypothetical protein